jgi:hypothetical protein
MRMIPALLLVLLGGCAEVSYQGYSGSPRPDAELAIVRMWTPTTTNVFTSPGLLMKSIDGRPAGDVGRTSHAYLLPGEHEFEVGFIQVRAHNLLCGAICDAMFNKPRTFKATVEAGRTYVLKYVNDEQATVVLDDKGTDYDPRCLKAREFREAKSC